LVFKPTRVVSHESWVSIWQTFGRLMPFPYFPWNMSVFHYNDGTRLDCKPSYGRT
jgi:hypothetical protein